ncbi:MAG TPA: maleylpyruvate isomerase family mycothiol-dependent enzyme [Acidimicrobiales bacterium]|nr:maleylpyruvate isomerase family mycothiol-dependent enzyme [Acidimicrobiales bacterium]
MDFDWAGIVECEGAALAGAADMHPEAPVPAAPGWDTTELLRHVGLMHSRARLVLGTGTMERPTVENGMLPEPPREGVVEWFRANLAGLVDDLRSIDDPDRPVYAFSPAHQRAGFWPRRMAHETTIHRVDAEQAAGLAPGTIAPAFAVDGLDEVCFVFVPVVGSGRSPGDGRTVHLHATDAEGEWLVRFAEGEVVAEAGHAKGDAAVRSSASDLLLWIWGRLDLDRLDVFGDRTAAEALRAVTTL